MRPELYLIFTLASCFITAILVIGVKRLAWRIGAVDRPNSDRKMHSQPTPLLGGLAIWLTTNTLIWVVYWLQLADFTRISPYALVGITIGSLLIMIGGILDDRFNLPAVKQIIWPLAAAAIAVISGVTIQYVTNPAGDNSNLIIYLTPFLGSIIAFVWIMGMMYTTKFLDGLDGLVSGIGAIAALFIFIASLSWDRSGSATALWALILGGSLIGFLIHNWHPAKIFLGEGGSVYVGFMLAVLSIISGSKIMTTLLVVGIPVLDVAWVIIQRFLHGHSPFRHADRLHLHFRLFDRGLSQRQTVLVLYLVALCFGIIATITTSLGKIILGVVLVVVMSALLALSKKDHVHAN